LRRHLQRHVEPQQEPIPPILTTPITTRAVRYAKLSFPHYSPAYVGTRFKLYERGRLVWGTEIEQPPSGKPLEYRNIVVTTASPEDFTIQPSLPIDVEISDERFSTPQQDAYDNKYGVHRHHDGLWYTTRGNDRNPRFLLVTFPEFGPSTSEVSYAVSYMSQLTDDDLKHTILIAFQDRYQVHGTYMITDDEGLYLYPRVRKLLLGLIGRFGIPAENVIFFGASKGASIAIMQARDFPAAHMIVAAPQINLRYYLQSKPFFRNNLFHHLKAIVFDEPLDLLKAYLAEGRDVAYFYSDSDELSNYSLIERLCGMPSLTKFRVDGDHGQVVEQSLATMLCFIKQIISSHDPAEFNLAYSDICQSDDGLALQIGLPNLFVNEGDFNVYLRSDADGTTFYHILEKSAQRTVWFTNRAQIVRPSLNRVTQINAFSVFTAHGAQFLSPAVIAVPGRLDEAASDQGGFNLLDLSSGSSRQRYWVVAGAGFGAFSYRFRGATGGSRRLHVYCHLDDTPGFDATQWETEPSAMLDVVCDNQWDGLAVLLSRVQKQARLVSVSVDVNAPGSTLPILWQIGQVDLPNVEVSLRDASLTPQDYAFSKEYPVLPDVVKWLQEGRIQVIAPEKAAAPLFRPFAQ